MDSEKPREENEELNLEDTIEMPAPEETLEFLQEQLENLNQRYKNLNEELSDFNSARDPREIKKEMYQIREEQDATKKKIRNKEAPEYLKVLNENADVPKLKKQLVELLRHQIDLEERLNSADGRSAEILQEELDELDEEINQLQQQVDTAEDEARGKMKDNIIESRKPKDTKIHEEEK